MRRLWRRVRDSFYDLRARLWWKFRSLKARIVCWYIERIWMPRQPEIKFSVEEQQAALATINDILQELEEEERQCSR